MGWLEDLIGPTPDSGGFENWFPFDSQTIQPPDWSTVMPDFVQIQQGGLDLSHLLTPYQYDTPPEASDFGGAMDIYHGLMKPLSAPKEAIDLSVGYLTDNTPMEVQGPNESGQVLYDINKEVPLSPAYAMDTLGQISGSEDFMSRLGSGAYGMAVDPTTYMLNKAPGLAFAPGMTEQIYGGMQQGDQTGFADALLGAGGLGLIGLGHANEIKQGFDTLADVTRPGQEGSIRNPFAKPDANVVFHGSPHEFDAFDINKMGTGEGNQAYGPGMYMAEEPSVAGNYARNPSGFNDPITQAASDLLNAYKGDKQLAIDSIDVILNSPPSVIYKPDYNFDDLTKMKAVIQAGIPQGNLYAAEIPPPDQFLDYDTTLANQPEIVKNAIPDIIQKAERYEPNLLKAVNDAEATIKAMPYLSGDVEQAINNFRNNPNPSNISEVIDSFYNYARTLGRSGTDDANIYKAIEVSTDLQNAWLAIKPDRPASSLVYPPDADQTYFNTQKLKQGGVKGVKYTDAFSRGKDSEASTSNYVVYDPNDISIIGKSSEPDTHGLSDHVVAMKQKYGPRAWRNKMTDAEVAQFDTLLNEAVKPQTLETIPKVHEPEILRHKADPLGDLDIFEANAEKDFGPNWRETAPPDVLAIHEQLIDKSNDAAFEGYKPNEAIDVTPITIQENFPISNTARESLTVASNNLELKALMDTLGINGIQVDSPHTFDLSQEGGISSEGNIRINPNVKDFGQTLGHELGHEIWERLSSENRKLAEQLVKDNPRKSGYTELDELFAELVGEGNKDAIALAKLVGERQIKVNAPEVAVNEPTRLSKGTARTWDDIQNNRGYISDTDNLHELAKQDDRLVIIKDVNGGRHRIPASLAAQLLENPRFSGYVREIFLPSGPAQHGIPKFDNEILQHLPDMAKAVDDVVKKQLEAPKVKEEALPEESGIIPPEPPIFDRNKPPQRAYPEQIPPAEPPKINKPEPPKPEPHQKLEPLSALRSATMKTGENLTHINKEIGERVAAYDKLHEESASKDIYKIREATQGFDKASEQRIVKFLDGESIVLNPKEHAAATKLRSMLDDVASRAKANEVLVGYRKGYFPRKYADRWEWETSPHAFKDTNLPFGNLEKSRQGNKQNFRRDFRVLEEYANEAERRIAEAVHLGKDLRHVTGDKFVGDRATVTYLNKALGRITGRSNLSGDISTRVSRTLDVGRKITALGDLTFAALYQPAQFTATASHFGFRRAIRGVVQTFKNYGAEKLNATRSRALWPNISHEVSKALGSSGYMHGIPKLDSAMRVHANVTGRLLVEDALRGNSYARKQIESLGLNLRDKNIVDQVGKAVSDKTQLRTGTLDMPLWTHSPYGKIASQYSSFAYAHSRLVLDLLKHPVQNLGQIARFAAIGVLAGEGVADLREALKAIIPGKGEDDDVVRRMIEAAAGENFDNKSWAKKLQAATRSKRIDFNNPAWRAVQNLSMIGGAGIFQSIAEKATSGQYWQIPLGPMGSLGVETATALQKDIEKLGKGDYRFKESQKNLISNAPIPLVSGRKLSNYVLPPHDWYLNPDLKINLEDYFKSPTVEAP